MKRFTIIYAVALSLILAGYGPGVLAQDMASQISVDQLKIVKTNQSVLYQSYTDTDKGPAGVLGYYFDTYFSKHAYYSLAIFGAVSGNRGGYGIAAIGLGYSWPITKRFYLDARSLVGSGGGGGVPAGGGIAIQYSLGANYRIFDRLSLSAGYGHLNFPSGPFITPVWHLGVSIDSDTLALK